MDEEIKSIENNDTWDMGYFIKEIKLIGEKWLYNRKLNEKGEIDRFKEKLVVKGFS